jgi:hypothetical protein
MSILLCYMKPPPNYNPLYWGGNPWSQMFIVRGIGLSLCFRWQNSSQWFWGAEGALKRRGIEFIQDNVNMGLAHLDFDTWSNHGREVRSCSFKRLHICCSVHYLVGTKLSYSTCLYMHFYIFIGLITKIDGTKPRLYHLNYNAKITNSAIHLFFIVSWCNTSFSYSILKLFIKV